MNEFKVGEKITIVDGDRRRRTTITALTEYEGLYKVTGGGIISVSFIEESDSFKPIFEEI